MNDNSNLIGCFVSATQPFPTASDEEKKLSLERGKEFRSYIWGENCLCDILKKLKRDDYGKDVSLILLQFYLDPIQFELDNLKPIDSYRKSEKSIGIPIIINTTVFLNLTAREKQITLRDMILEKIDLLSDVVKKKKLDTDVASLKLDIIKILS